VPFFTLIPLAARVLITSSTEAFGLSVRNARMAWDLLGVSAEGAFLTSFHGPLSVAALSFAFRSFFSFILPCTT
jgi:hypothetical protein